MNAANASHAEPTRCCIEPADWRQPHDRQATRQVEQMSLAPHMLRAWLDVAGALGRICTLEVLAGDRARLLYARLGLELDLDQHADSPVPAMTHPRLLARP
ncbi:MAG TPA: hypothetical protein VHG29_09650 [Novosphingobium sp.]|nr:hypothetical protein [Novosphingobium sp.]